MSGVTLVRPVRFFHWLRLYKTYLSAFPAAERKPFSLIRRMERLGKMDVWQIMKDGKYLGIATTINGSRLLLIDYLALDAARRCHGYGSAALEALRRQYRDRDVFLEIESVWEDAPNLQQRLRRKKFYLGCGMKPMGVMVVLFGVKMELLSWGCKITHQEYLEFYRQGCGEWAAGHIRPAHHPEGETP